MNVSTILISKEDAERKLEQYKSIVARKRTREDDKLQSLYAAVSKGARVINVANAFKQTDLNEKGQPKLAMARADWKTVYCVSRPRTTTRWTRLDGTIGFSAKRQWNHLATQQNIVLPEHTFDEGRLFSNQLYSAVPHIPPELRPKFGLHNYHILFEVKEWQTYPVDPFLLRRIAGQLYVVEAEWELTDLEASLLSGLMQGN